MVAHACNSGSLGGLDGGIAWGQEFETSLGNIVRAHFYKKRIQILVRHVVHTCSYSYTGG